ncbi:hypothetical protein B0H13DRAFT_2315213 [Mycena leptocephala]|nr:hypothetical protein B0H13DRAFT_2315213 [Mycena leptocephala]
MLAPLTRPIIPAAHPQLHVRVNTASATISRLTSADELERETELIAFRSRARDGAGEEAGEGSFARKCKARREYEPFNLTWSFSFNELTCRRNMHQTLAAHV